MPEELSKRDEGLKDPYESLIAEMKTNPSDAAALAQFVDASVIVEELAKIKYDVRKKIQILGEIIKTGSNAEKMRAMNALDAIRESSLAHRGIMVRPNGHVPQGSTMPVGLPQAVEAVTLSETRRKATVTMRKQYDQLGDLPKTQQPLKENTNDQTPNESAGDDSYFDDEGDGTDDVFRPSTAEQGRGWDEDCTQS